VPDDPSQVDCCRHAVAAAQTVPEGLMPVGQVALDPVHVSFESQAPAVV
jgi:hypothetical protein